MTDVSHGIDDTILKVLCDPQTSGGLLIVLPGEDAHRLLSALHEQGIVEAAIIGEITDTHPGRIVIKP
jgi:selenide,water dikinase